MTDASPMQDATSTSTDTTASGPVDPFGGDSKSFTITKPINLDQLHDEIVTRTTVQVQVALSATDASQPISDVNPATLWVSPGSIDGPTVTGAITDHVPNPNYGVSQSQQDVAAVINKINAGTTLTMDDVTIALKAILIPTTA